MHRVVPDLIVENYRAGRFDGEFSAVGMFMDLSGFSTMTDVLMQHGQHGAEVLAGLMHSVFDPVVKGIFEYGGRIVSFAGDGIMVLYPMEGHGRRTALRALTSAWVIQKHLLEDPGRRTEYGYFSFSIKIGLSTGSVAWRILRSEDGAQGIYYFRGSAVEGSALAEHQAKAGDIILTKEMKGLLGNSIRSVPNDPFFRFTEFRVGLPTAMPYVLPPMDLEASRVFMPEDVILHDIRGEFRQIVNLFMRIPDLPDEKIKKFVDAAFELRRQYGGLLTRLDFGDKGCNMLVLWGAPIAYENDISRALRFILDMQARMDFPVTVGVTYYIAHAGYLGSEMCEDYTCYGWGVNLASRFMMSAPAGAIWVDERVARMVSHWFEIDPVGSQRFKGFAEEQRVNVLRRRRQDVSTIYPGEMVGRENELNQMKGFVEPLWAGKFAGVLAVSGEAGIGKGRLIHAFSSSDLFREHAVLWAMTQVDPILKQSFGPLRSWLLKYFGITKRQTDDERKRAFDSKLDSLLASLPDPELLRELDRTRSILGALVDVFWGESLYSQLDAEGRYNNTFLALRNLVAAESLRQPFLLFIDDAHLIDEDSKAFLLQLKRSLSAFPASYPVAVILAFRKIGNVPIMEDGILDEEIILHGISREEAAHLAEILLGGPPSPPLTDLVTARSEGNPYFAQQIIRYMQEEKLLEMSNTGWAPVKKGSRSLLPGDIRALLIARLDQLKQEVKHAVQTASVLGREFEVRVLSRMLGPGTDTAVNVSEAEKAAIWSPLNEMQYIFQHGLLRDAAYTMQMRARRKELHVLAVQTLESLYQTVPSNRYVELAYHAEQGDLSDQARHYYTLAGKTASDTFQNALAVDYYSRAIAYTPFTDLAAQYDLVAERAELFSHMGKRDLQLRDLDSLEKWAATLGDKFRILKALRMRSYYHYLMGDYASSLASAKRTENYAGAFEDTEENLKIQTIWALSLHRLGRLDEAMQRAQATLKLDSAIKNPTERGKILSATGLIALDRKEPADAFGYFFEALEVARKIKNRALELRALNNLAMAEGAVGGNYATARTYYEQAYTLTREIGDRNMESSTLENLGFVAGMQGDFPAARSYHEQALRASREIGNRYHEVYVLINLSAVLGIQNEAETALQHAHQAIELSQKISERTGEAWAWHYLGHAYLLKKEFQPARDAYLKSIAIRHELDQPSLSMEPIAGLVEAYLDQNDIDAAMHEAEKILEFFECGSNLGGTDEPLRVYYACYQVLLKKGDPRSEQVLKDAIKLLGAQVSNFSDKDARKRYIENIPWRRAIWNAASDI